MRELSWLGSDGRWRQWFHLLPLLLSAVAAEKRVQSQRPEGPCEAQRRRREHTAQAPRGNEDAPSVTGKEISHVVRLGAGSRRQDEGDAPRARDVGDAEGLGGQLLTTAALVGVGRTRALRQEELRADIEAAYPHGHGLAVVQVGGWGDLQHRGAARDSPRTELAHDVDRDPTPRPAATRRGAEH